ncbi:MAG: hypothetical protein ACR2J3_07040 [Aridibacter sp.]
MLIKTFSVLIVLAVLMCLTQISLFAQTTSNKYDNVRFFFELKSKDKEESKSTFKVSEKIIIEVFLENYSNEPFRYIDMGKSYQYRFELRELGVKRKIHYRKDKYEYFTNSEETPPEFSRSLLVSPIDPGNTQKLATLALYERYDDLKPGSYELMIEYKSGESVEKAGKKQKLRLKSTVYFDIVPNDDVTN